MYSRCENLNILMWEKRNAVDNRRLPSFQVNHYLVVGLNPTAGEEQVLRSGDGGRLDQVSTADQQHAGGAGEIT